MERLSHEETEEDGTSDMILKERLELETLNRRTAAVQNEIEELKKRFQLEDSKPKPGSVMEAMRALERQAAARDKELEELRKRLQVKDSKPKPGSVMEAMRARLKDIEFPSDISAYELPYLDLPESNPHRARVHEKQVVEDWFHKGTPDFLLTRLDQPVVQLTEFLWDESRRRLSRGSFEPNKAVLQLGEDTIGDMVALVSASGAGKTRYLMEQGSKHFCIYLVTRWRAKMHGVGDLSSFLDVLPENIDSKVDEIRKKLVEFMGRVILARLAVLERVLSSTPDLKPFQWLALQLFPGRFTNGIDVFSEALDASESVSLGAQDLELEWGRHRRQLSFIAIDEAQYADQKYPNTFQSSSDTQKRSALSVLVSPLSMIRVNVIVSGTGLGIESAMEMIASNATKKDISTRLVGSTTFLDEIALRKAFADRGFVGEVDEDVSKLFSGRPRFGMRLAEALLLQQNPNEVSAEIVKNFANFTSRLLAQPIGDAPLTAKNVYSELRFAAMEWVLRGRGGILLGGDIALELAVCALDTSSRGEGQGSTFVIQEPLVVRAFHNLSAVDFEHISNESPSRIRIMFEDYIALNAIHLVDGVVRISVNQVSEHTEFGGPWKLAVPSGDERIGILSKDGEEPRHIREILECAGSKGPSVVFPGTYFGADLVIAVARDSNPNKKLLLMAQVKACQTYSTDSAHRTLEFPYHQNRDIASQRTIPDQFKEAHRQFEQILFDSSVSVVHVVVKFPADSQQGTKRISMHSLKKTTPQAEKQALKVTFDGSNAMEFLGPLRKGLDALLNVKNFLHQ